MNLGTILGGIRGKSMKPPSYERLTGAGSNETGSTAATFSTRWITIQGSRLSVEAVWSGTTAGTFSLECKFGDGSARVVPGSAAEFTANGQLQPAGSASSAVWNWSSLPGTHWRLTFARSGGTGTLTSAYCQAE